MKTRTNKHLPCPDCRSSDALVQYEDHTYCFSCQKYTKLNETERSMAEEAPKKPSAFRQLPTDFLPLKDRGISEKAARKFNVTYIDDPSSPQLHFYPYTRRGKHIANKIRYRETKAFAYEGDSTKLDLFGQSVFPAGSAKTITLVEGECDALAVYDMMGDWPVVSVQSASTAERDCRNAYEYLNSFDEIVVAFDKDEGKIKSDGTTHYPGQEAAIKVAEMFPLGKVRILTLAEMKDPNDYLRAGKGKAFKDEWWRAPKFTPAGLKLGSELWNDVINPPQYETIYYPFEGFNEKTFGLRLSEFVLLNAPPKVGKTTIIGEIVYHILQNNKESRIGLMKLEESNRDTALNLMSIHAGKRLHLPDVWDTCSEEEIKSYFDATVNSERVVIWDHFGSNSVQAVLDKVRHMHALGCKYIVLDHISIVVSDQSGDERKQLDEIATKLKTLCMELNICVIAVVHQNRQGEIRGTQGLEQLANIIFKLERDKLSDNEVLRNIVKVSVTENRFCGETGIASYLYYDRDTGRLREISEADYNKAAVGGEAPW